MIAASTPAWLGFASGIFATVVGAVVAIRQTRLKSALEAKDRAEEVLKRYREPLAAAAFDLQSRLYNILALEFFDNFGEPHPRSEEAVRTTLFRIAQYFGWSEILRRDIQFLSFPEAEETRRVIDLQRRIAKAFLTDDYGEELMIWADQQRAVGELMIVEEHGKVLCMGYARFRKECGGDGVFASWRGQLRDDVVGEASHERMREVQHLLCQLVETLDAKRVRYSADDLKRAVVTPPAA
jgi:hypothetical protein